ncbi:MAG: hypothetical protein ACK6DC_00230 [Planctomycetota bacterium]|jgi:hypothetical protein
MLEPNKTVGKPSHLLLVFQGMHLDVYAMDPGPRIQTIQVPWANLARYELLMERFIEAQLRDPYRRIFREGRLIFRDTIQPRTTQQFIDAIQLREVLAEIDALKRTLVVGDSSK